LDRRQQQRHEDANDGNDDEQLDQRKRDAFTLAHCPESTEGQLDQREASVYGTLATATAHA
jgi:hypothetical protein